MEWLNNEGKVPEAKAVDIFLNVDEPGWPGMDCIRYGVDPHKWDWQRGTGGTEIVKYRIFIP